MGKSLIGDMSLSNLGIIQVVIQVGNWIYESTAKEKDVSQCTDLGVKSSCQKD